MTSRADYADKIPNNVELREDRRLQRALESWQPNFLNWWDSMGPTLATRDVYLRTAVNVGREGEFEQRAGKAAARLDQGEQAATGHVQPLEGALEVVPDLIRQPVVGVVEQ